MADVVAVDRRLKNIITQSALISFVARDAIAAKLASVTSKTLAELGLAKPGNVVKVKRVSTVSPSSLDDLRSLDEEADICLVSRRRPRVGCQKKT